MGGSCDPSTIGVGIRNTFMRKSVESGGEKRGGEDTG